MKYWLNHAVEENKGPVHIKIEDEVITYRHYYQYEKIINVHAGGFHIEPAKAAIGPTVQQCNDQKGQRRWETLVKKGVTTTLIMMPVKKASQLDHVTEQSLNLLNNVPIDYLIVPSVHSRQLTPAFMRQLLRRNFPVVEIYFTSLSECPYVAWDWIKQALGPEPLSFIFRFPPPDSAEEQIEKNKWEKALSSHFHIVTFENGALLSKNEMQTIGLYPVKGTVARGDADYLLYYESKRVNQVDRHVSEGQPPDIVVLRGKVLKAGHQVQLLKGFGRCCNAFLPGRLRSIQRV
ncbi:hypothetical protein SAMN05192534_101519 [Alteribacillus persepolensis]|uniref:Uncharacterized protein n=1 Tax=Alteribacillus persepolensis TaxID=568899 RepID=A0A1G7ZFE8_9BACI|nr:hypothetical protein [Alteribacillus persepolensis]SDH07297.1 hypothetical protein SAMN05192534_101519 [Alteribacillus persepolensis]